MNSPNTHTDSPVCVVTGGSSGIGLATCVRFAREGYRVALCGRDEGRLAAANDAIQSELGGPADLLVIPADVGRPEQVREFIDRVKNKFHRIDVLVNNAGVAPYGRIESMPMDEVKRALDVNVVSVFSTTQAVWQIMKAQGQGVIINLTSMSAIDAFPGLGLYGSCKAWVESFTKAAASEGQEAGIRVFAVRPGAVETPMLRGLFPDFPADEALPPEAVASLIYTLTATEFAHSSGQVFEVKR